MAAGFSSMMLVPLVSRDEPIGASQGDAFTEDDLRLAERVGVQISGAISSFELLERLRLSNQQLHALSARVVDMQEQDRRHIARELHDEVGQILTGLNIIMETCHEKLGDLVAPYLAPAQELVQDLMSRVRELSLDLRPSHLDDLGILPALRWHLKTYTSRTGVRVDLSHSGISKRFPPDVETAAYRIVQEALTNVARHAGVTKVVVKVRAYGGVMNIQVEDEGLGFNLDDLLTARFGLGISGMRERARSMGGHFSIDSSPGEGTRLTARLPLAVKSGPQESDG